MCLFLHIHMYILYLLRYIYLYSMGTYVFINVGFFVQIGLYAASLIPNWARSEVHFSPLLRPDVLYRLFGSFRKSFSHQRSHVAYFVAHLFIAFVFYDQLLFCSYFVSFLFGLFDLSALAISHIRSTIYYCHSLSVR